METTSNRRTPYTSTDSTSRTSEELLRSQRLCLRVHSTLLPPVRTVHCGRTVRHPALNLPEFGAHSLELRRTQPALYRHAQVREIAHFEIPERLCCIGIDHHRVG